MTDLTKLFNKHFKVEQISRSLSWSEYIEHKTFNYKRNKKPASADIPDILRDNDTKETN